VAVGTELGATTTGCAEGNGLGACVAVGAELGATTGCPEGDGEGNRVFVG